MSMRRADGLAASSGRCVVVSAAGTTTGRMRTDGERHGGTALADRRNERRSGAPTRPRHHQKEQPNRQWDLNGRMLGVGFGFFDVPMPLDEATGARGGLAVSCGHLLGNCRTPPNNANTQKGQFNCRRDLNDGRSVPLLTSLTSHCPWMALLGPGGC